MQLTVIVDDMADEPLFFVNAGQFRTPEVGLIKPSAVQACSSQGYAPQVGPAQIAAAKIASLKPRAIE